MVPAQVAEEHPEASAEIAGRGKHEVGYHGYYHESVLELPIEEAHRHARRALRLHRERPQRLVRHPLISSACSPEG